MSGDDMEAGYDDILEEEFRSGKIAEEEEEEDAKIRREQRKRAKWRRMQREGLKISLDEVSSEPSSQEDY